MLNCVLCWVVLLFYVELCYSMLNCVVVCWIVLFYVELCCSMLNCVVVCWIGLFYVELCCSMFQLCCSMLNCVVLCWIVLFYVELCCSMLNCVVLCWIVLLNVELCCCMLNCVILCWIVLFYVELCCSMLNCVVIFWIVLFCCELCWSMLNCVVVCWIVLFYVLFVSIVLFYVLFVCNCLLYHCHRVSTQLQLTNISYHKINHTSPHVNCFFLFLPDFNQNWKPLTHFFSQPSTIAFHEKPIRGCRNVLCKVYGRDDIIREVFATSRPLSNKWHLCHTHAAKLREVMSYAYFWVILRRLYFICRRFGTLCSIFIGR